MSLGTISTFDCMGLHINNCGLQHKDPAHSFGPIVRTEYILQYITSGKGVLKVRDRTYPLKKGDLFLLVPGVLLYYAADPEDPYTYFWVGFGGSNASGMMERSGFSETSYVRSLSSAEVSDCMARLFDLVVTGSKERDKLFAVSEFYRLLGLLGGDEPRHENGPDEYIRRAVDFISEHYREDIRIRDVCDAIGLNRTYFSVIFKRAMGTSPVEYLIDYRLTQACKLFRTNLSITEISGLSGFGDPANFSVRFKQYTGHSPREYRKLMFSAEK